MTPEDKEALYVMLAGLYLQYGQGEIPARVIYRQHMLIRSYAFDYGLLCMELKEVRNTPAIKFSDVGRISDKGVDFIKNYFGESK